MGGSDESKYFFMKHFVILSFFLLFNLTTFSQNIDSISTLMDQYDYQGAIDAIEKSDTGVTDYRLLKLKAVSLKTMSKFSEAIVCYDSIYQSDTANMGILVELADCYKAMMNYQKPLELYEKALKIRPKNHYIMQLIAGVYLTMEKFREAGHYYQMACMNDTSGFLLKQIGLCYEKELEEVLAIEYYNKAIQWSPDDYQPVFRLANLYKNKLKIDLGLAVTDSFLSIGHMSVDVVRLSGYLHYLNQDFVGAVERFANSLTLGDSSLFVWKYLGYSYFKQNDFPNTIACLGKVFEKDSSDAELCYALALAHDVPESIRYFYAAINLTSPAIPILSDLFRDLSLALTKDRKYEEGLDALLRALELTPRDASLIYKVGIHYDNWMDDKNTALKYYRDFMVTRTDPDAPFVVTGTSIIDQDDYRHAERRIKDIEENLYPFEQMVKDTTMND
jgi:tetratricopeptide (TPR) repeat protein